MKKILGKAFDHQKSCENEAKHIFQKLLLENAASCSHELINKLAEKERAFQASQDMVNLQDEIIKATEEKYGVEKRHFIEFKRAHNSCKNRINDLLKELAICEVEMQEKAEALVNMQASLQSTQMKLQESTTREADAKIEMDAFKEITDNDLQDLRNANQSICYGKRQVEEELEIVKEERQALQVKVDFLEKLRRDGDETCKQKLFSIEKERQDLQDQVNLFERMHLDNDETTRRTSQLIDAESQVSRNRVDLLVENDEICRQKSETLEDERQVLQVTDSLPNKVETGEHIKSENALLNAKLFMPLTKFDMESSQVDRLKMELENSYRQLKESNELVHNLTKANENLKEKLRDYVSLQDELVTVKKKLLVNNDKTLSEVIHLREECQRLNKELENEKTKSMINKGFSERMESIRLKIVEDSQTLQQLKAKVYNESGNVLATDKVTVPMSPPFQEFSMKLRESEDEVTKMLRELEKDDQRRRELWNELRQVKNKNKKHQTTNQSASIIHQSDQSPSAVAIMHPQPDQSPPVLTEQDNALIKNLNRVNRENSKLKSDIQQTNVDYDVCREENTKLADQMAKMQVELNELRKERQRGEIADKKVKKLTEQLNGLKQKCKLLIGEKRCSQNMIKGLTSDVERYRRKALGFMQTAKHCCVDVKTSKEEMERKLKALEEEHEQCLKVAKDYKILRRKYEKCRQALQKQKTKSNESQSPTSGDSSVLVSEKNVINLRLHLDQGIVIAEEQEVKLDEKKSCIQQEESICVVNPKVEEKHVDGETSTESDVIARQIQEGRSADSDVTVNQSKSYTDATTITEAVSCTNQADVVEYEKVQLKNDELEKLNIDLHQHVEELQCTISEQEEKINKLIEEMDGLESTATTVRQTYQEQLTSLQQEIKILKEEETVSSKRREIDLLNLKIREMVGSKEKNEGTIKNLKTEKYDLQMDVQRMQREITNLTQKLEFTESNRVNRRNAAPSNRGENTTTSSTVDGYPSWLRSTTNKQEDGKLNNIPDQSVATKMKTNKPVWLSSNKDEQVGNSLHWGEANTQEVAKRPSRPTDVPRLELSDSDEDVRNQQSRDQSRRALRQQTNLQTLPTQRHVSKPIDFYSDDDDFLSLDTPLKKKSKPADQKTAEQPTRRSSTKPMTDFYSDDDDFLSLDTPLKKKSKPADQKTAEQPTRRRRATTMQDLTDSIFNESSDNVAVIKPAQSVRPRVTASQKSLWDDTPQQQKPQVASFNNKKYLIPSDDEAKPATHYASWSDDESELINKCLKRQK